MIEKTEHTLKFNTGKTTCAYAVGKFCPFFKLYNFGNTPYCSYFQEDLNGEEYVLRSDTCLNTFRHD